MSECADTTRTRSQDAHDGGPRRGGTARPARTAGRDRRRRGGGQRGVGPHRPVRERRKLAHQHRQRLLRRAPVLRRHLARLRRHGLRGHRRRGQQGPADRRRHQGPARPGLGRVADLLGARRGLRERSRRIGLRLGRPGRPPPSRRRSRPSVHRAVGQDTTGSGESAASKAPSKAPERSPATRAAARPAATTPSARATP